jgi:predicted O-linked N-acetylglucosamine transferase (SPINDLY family)
MTDSRAQLVGATASPPARDREALIAEAVAKRRAGHLAEAAELFVLALRNGTADAGLLLFAGETFFRLGRLFAAHDAVTAALAGAPETPDALFLFGRILTALGRAADAVSAFERAIAQRADYAAAWRFMAPPLLALDRRNDAAGAFDRADALQPESADHYNQIGIDLLAARRPVEAEAAFRRAIELNPSLAAAHQNLGVTLAAQDRIGEAIPAERRAIELAPGSAAALNNLSVFESSGGDFDAARRAVAQALRIDPQYADALQSLAQIRLEEGDVAAAIDLLERVRANQPEQPPPANLLLARNYTSRNYDAAAFSDAKQIAHRLRPPGPAFTFDRHDGDPERRLRIGYVSGDFRRHSCASFVRPLFAAHDAHTVELFAYSENPLDDEITAELRARTHAWRPITGLSDAAAAEMVHRDGIDILVDLSGHMAGNRLAVFALKPAPVQVTWLGYPDTTGLATIDYRLTDARADPPGASETFHSERLWRLPQCFFVYAADAAAPPPRHAATDRRDIVFGSFNHLPKVTPDVVSVWAQILSAVPQARLLLKAKRLGDPVVRDRYTRLFAEAGIASDRLELVGWQADPADHLALYRQIDIALDPFPYNGTTTTCEALWMGVPVVTLAGERHAGRVGASLLGALGLDGLVTATPRDYVTRAVDLARDPAQLAALSHGLRERMSASPICDAHGFARDLEMAFRDMWREWCHAGTL